MSGSADDGAIESPSDSSPTSPELLRASAELMDAVGRLRRAARRRVRRDWPHRPLTEAQVELLRLLFDRPGLRVREAAADLGLAPNTVSTLVGGLVRRGLVRRRVDTRDSRAVRLMLSAAATRRISAWRDRRQQIVAEALSRLPAPSRRAIERALPALVRLAREVEGA
jgi:DNA-binding MarR family transcriptional regulator